MPGPIVHNETTATNLGGFVTVLANLTRRAYALEEPPEYVVTKDPCTVRAVSTGPLCTSMVGVCRQNAPTGSLEGQLPLSHKPSNWQPEKL